MEPGLTSEPHGTMYHILIVDEEEHLLWALERNLFPERDDVTVHTANSGEEGLEILEQETVDLLISDIKMPGEIDGFQLILRAKEMAPDARVMIITAFGTHRIQNFAERMGISHYIEKPFTVDELRGAVQEVIDEHEGFQGVLSDLELTDIIQMLCLSKRTALLHLKHRERRGRIVFDTGDVVHAQFDGEIGAEAVYEMLSLRQGDIFMQSDFEPVERSIDIGWQDLLLEAVKRTDEARMEQQQERTRQELGSLSEATALGTGEELAPSEEASENEPQRTQTPIGVAAATMGGEESESNEEESTGLGNESSSGMFFSEEELQEIEEASEAAVEEDAASESDESDASSQIEESSQPEADQSTPQMVEDREEPAEVEDPHEPGEPLREEAPTAEFQIEDWAKAATMYPEDAEKPPSNQQHGEVDGGDDLSTAAVGARSDGEASGDRPPSHSGAFAAVSSRDSGEFDTLDNGMPAGTEASLGADGEAEPPVDASGPFASVRERTGRGNDGVQSASPAGVESREFSGGNQTRGAGKRQRTGTSPGMAVLNPNATPASEPTEESSEEQQPVAPQQQSSSSDVLDSFVDECSGLMATALVSVEQGRITEQVDVAYGGGLATDALGERLSEFFSRAEQSVAALGQHDQLRELQLVLDDAYLLLRSVEQTPLIHIAVVDREISLGIALVLMRQFADQLSQGMATQ